MDPLIKKIQQIVAVNEGDSSIPSYGDVEWESDQRGVTAGISGWTSGDNDLLNITDAYPPLKKWSTQLHALNTHNAEFEAEWKAEGQKQEFKDLQDQVQYTEYFKPGIDLAASYGLTSPLAQAIFADSATQHGLDGDPDSLNVMAAKTKAILKESGAEKFPDTYERKFLTLLLTIRRSVLLNPYNHDTKADWEQSVGRVDALMALLNANNFDLVTPFSYNPWGDDPGFVIT